MRKGQALVLLLALVLGAGCQALGIRADVSESEARALLARAVGLAQSGQLDRLCALSPAEASTCADSLTDLAGLLPPEGPSILCVVPAPEEGPLRNGQVVVVEGTDTAGETYTSEFIVYDSGAGVGVLDAVYWNGLTVASYTEDTVTWRFDSSSQTCDRGALPVSSTPED